MEDGKSRRKTSREFPLSLLHDDEKKSGQKQMAFDIENLVNGIVNVNLFFHVHAECAVCC